MTCPRCQALEDRVRELEDVLGIRNVIPPMLGLSVISRRYLSMLMARPGVTLTREDLMQAHGDRRYDMSQRSVDSQIKRFRALLRDNGIGIRSDYGLGYYLPADDVERLSALISSRSVSARPAPGSCAHARHA